MSAAVWETMEGTRIKELTANQDILGYYLVRESTLKEGANGPYLDMILSDRTGNISAKIWQCQTGDARLYVRGTMVKVMAKIVEYRGNLQMNIGKIRLVEPDDGIDVEDYVDSAPMVSGEMYDRISGFAREIGDGAIRSVVEYFLTLYREKLMYYPAAKSIHHAIRGGLLYHTLKMLEAAEKMAEVYGSLNRDLLYAGVILHDMEKVNEMESDRLGMAEYTLEGELLGHLVMGARNIDRVARELNVPESTSLLLQHMIISHHLKAEYGSPKPPMLPEAEVLHHLDMIDARIYSFNHTLESLEEGEMSQRVFALDNRRVYKIPPMNGDE